MSVIHFRGAVLKHAALPPIKEGQVYARFHFTTDFSEPVRNELVLGALPPGMNLGTYKGLVLNGSALVLSPVSPALANYTVECGCGVVDGFEAVRLKDQQGDVTSVYLRFTVRSDDPDAVHRIETWRRHVGGAPGLLKLTYAEQGKLDRSKPKHDPQPEFDLVEPAEDTEEPPEWDTPAEPAATQARTTGTVAPAYTQKATRARKPKAREAIQ